MKLSRLLSVLDEKAPFSTALSFDNSGLLCGDPQREIRTVLLSLDVTFSVIDEAARRGADLILTHHPALFHEQKRFTPDDRVYALIARNIAAAAAHTNLDKAQDGVNDVLAQTVGLEQIQVWQGDDPDLIGRIGQLPCSTDLCVYAKMVRETLGANHLRFADGGVPVHRVAVCSGAGGDQWVSLRGTDVDTLLTGEAKYHHFLEAAQSGINLIEAGHFATEVLVLPVLERWLKQADPTLNVYYSSQTDPVRRLD